MAHEIEMPELIRDLIDWDSVDAVQDGEDGDEDVCELWKAYNEVVDGIPGARLGIGLGEALDELESVLTTYLVTSRLPSETWNNGDGPESWVEFNDVLASLPAETRDAWRSEIKEAMNDLMIQTAMP